jgi:hypothetical protein
MRKVGLNCGSPPFSRAATEIIRAILENIFPRLASVMAFPLLIFDHFECPDMFKYMFFCHPERVRQLADEPRDLRGKAQAGIPPFLRQLANSVGMTRKVYEFRSE